MIDSKGDAMTGYRLAAVLLMLATATALPAQDKGAKGAEKGRGGEKGQKGRPDNLDLREIAKSEFGGVAGPTTGKLNAPGKGAIAEIKVPAGQVFVGQPGAAKFASATKNTGGERWAGVIFVDKTGFIVFEYDDTGYIKDADKEKIDADSLMTNMKASDEEENKQRKAKGWPTLSVEGWADKPYYDPQTKNLTWAIRLKSESGHVSINHEVRLLGREGVMRATLVCGPEEFGQAKQGVNPLLAGYSFTAGNTYAEWKPGDKVAAYGLAGLIAGGAVFGAAKLGILAKLGAVFAKGGKAIVLAVVAVIAGIGKFFSSIFGRRRD